MIEINDDTTKCSVQLEPRFISNSVFFSCTGHYYEIDKDGTTVKILKNFGVHYVHNANDRGSFLLRNDSCLLILRHLEKVHESMCNTIITNRTPIGKTELCTTVLDIKLQNVRSAMIEKALKDIKYVKWIQSKMSCEVV